MKNAKDVEYAAKDFQIGTIWMTADEHLFVCMTPEAEEIFKHVKDGVCPN